MSNSWSGGIDSFIYAGRTASIDAYNTYTVHKKIHVVIGTQYQYLDMSQKIITQLLKEIIQNFL